MSSGYFLVTTPLTFPKLPLSENAMGNHLDVGTCHENSTSPPPQQGMIATIGMVAIHRGRRFRKAAIRTSRTGAFRVLQPRVITWLRKRRWPLLCILGRSFHASSSLFWEESHTPSGAGIGSVSATVAHCRPFSPEGDGGSWGAVGADTGGVGGTVSTSVSASVL